MNDYTITINLIEELQTLNDTNELKKIFVKAKSTIVGGAAVVLVRKETSGKLNKFDEIDTLEALENYRTQVFKYLR